VNLPPFEQVLVEHGPDVHRYLVAGVGRQDADDCYQEVMVAALRNYPSLRDASNLRGWLFTIAYSKAIDSHRGRSRRAIPADVAAAERGHPGGQDAADDAEVWTAVRQLPPMQRAAVLHRFLHDLPFREIASIIGCSEPAARQNVRAGLAALRKDVER
jgi:RNA polymerase sigma factor (sigma-70 family)